MKYYQIQISEFQLRLLANNKDQARIIGLHLYKEYLILQNDTDLLFKLEDSLILKKLRIDQPE